MARMFSLILSVNVRPLRTVRSGGLQTSASVDDEVPSLAVGWGVALACASLIDPAYLMTCWVMVEAP